MITNSEGKARYVCRICGHVEWRWPGRGARVKRCHAFHADPSRESQNYADQCSGLLVQQDETTSNTSEDSQ